MEWIDALKIIIRIMYGAILLLWFITYFMCCHKNKFKEALMHLTLSLIVFGMAYCIMIASGVWF